MFCIAGIDANNNEIDGNMFALVKMQHKPQIGHFLNISVSAVLFISSLITMFVDMWRGSRWLYYKIRGIEPPQKAIATDETEEKAPLMTEKNKEENNVSTERNTVKEKDPNSDETTESSNGKKWGYTLGGIIAIVLIGIISFFAFSGNKQSDNVLGLQKPTWKKFVVVNGDDTYLYRQPNTNSDELKNSGCDGDCDPIYVWTEADLQEGYHIQNNVVSDGLVYPVIEETSDWYKVHISQYNVREAWIKKSACTEVKPEPITTATIKKKME